MLKRLLIIISMFLLSIGLCSCCDHRIRNVNNVVWKCEELDIIATSSQLQNPNYDNLSYVDDNSYSSIILFGQKYFCSLHLCNSLFMMYLYNPETDSFISFYGEREEFLWGATNSFVKEKNKGYCYSFVVFLNDVGQYYEYCVANGLEFPETLHFYAYEDK